jgi:anti-anti-sigma factor
MRAQKESTGRHDFARRRLIRITGDAMSVTPPSAPQRSLSIDRSTSSNGAPTLVCRGRLSSETWELLEKEVKSLSPQHEHVLADMSGVTFVDCAGLGGLLDIFVSAKSDGCYLELFNPQPQLRDSLNMTHLASAFLKGK